MIPSEVGPYRIEERLGTGGMGEVYRAYDHRLERWVAVKVVRTDRSEDADGAPLRAGTRAAARERFRREARAIAGLSHPNVVQIHDIVERDDGDCIVMELVEGENLARVLRRGRLPLPRTLELAREIAEGLTAAHAKGVVHRDLKAENVMIAPDGRAKILDFGLAKRLGPETHDTTLSVHGKILGTSHAMSPEQAQGLAVDHRSDLFSFGTLLYEMATGEAPFRREALAQTLTWVCTRNPEPAHAVAPDVPPALSELLAHLLEKDPARRPSGAGRVAEVLRYLEREIGSPPGDESHGPPATDPCGTESTSGAAAGSDPAESRSAVATLLGLPRPAYGPSEDTSSPREADATEEAPGRGGLRRLGRGRVAAVLVLVVLTAIGVAGFLAASNAGEVYVAVPEPTITADGDVASQELLPSAVRVALLQELLALDGVTALAPDQVDAVGATASAELARAVAADEVVTARLDCRRTRCQATLSRIRGEDGGLLWTQIFEVETGDLLGLSRAVGDRIRRAYGDRGVRRTETRLAIGGPEYEEFLRIREAYRTRLEGARLDGLLERIARLRRQAPRFLPVYLLEAELARARFAEETRAEEDLDRAFQSIEAARELAPDDPQPLFALVDIAVAAGRLDLAESALARLDPLEPPQAEMQALRARVLSRRGRTDEALELMGAAIERRPSEENLIRIAKIELDQGEMTAARGHLEEVLERAPDSFFGRALLAQVELMSGRLSRAVSLYERIVERSPSGAVWTNLGFAYMLEGRYPDAVEAFRHVLEVDPGSLFTLLNLADAELLAGSTERAETLYRRVLEIAESDPAGTADWQVLTVRSQALAHLGRPTEAVATVQEALGRAPDNPQTAFEAAVVYSLVGERRSALVNAERALRLGIEPVWFAFPWFDELREEPELRALLDRSS